MAKSGNPWCVAATNTGLGAAPVAGCNGEDCSGAAMIHMVHDRIPLARLLLLWHIDTVDEVLQAVVELRCPSF
eukprot:6458724-Amphidinium_carterae.4